MQVRIIKVGYLQTNCYILVNEDKYPGVIYFGYETTVKIVAYLSLITKSLGEKCNPLGAN